MGLFKEIYCAHCGKKTNLLTRLKLEDGNYLCSECAGKIPSFMKDSVKSHYDLDAYHSFLDYIEYSNNNLRPRFHETHWYYTLHIDTENRIFYIGYDINEKTVFFHFHNIEEFELIFKAEELKEGVLGDRVKGELLLILRMNTPYFYHEEILDYSAKAKAKKKFLSSRIEYENPRGMDEFLLFFNTAWQASLQEQEYYTPDEEDYSAANYAPTDSLREAMTLFMIDSLEDLTTDRVKSQYRRLMKTFHPDKGSADDTAYAQKINNAYEILKQHIS